MGAHEPPARSTSRQVKESPNAVYDRENQPRQAFEQQLKHNLSDDGQHTIGIGRPAPTPEPRLYAVGTSPTDRPPSWTTGGLPCPSRSNFKTDGSGSDDDGEMNVIPPWKLSEREEWAEARPWLAGLYFDLLMSLFLAVYPMIIGGTEQLYLAALPQNPDQHSPERPVLLEVDQEHPSTPFGPRYGTRA